MAQDKDFAKLLVMMREQGSKDNPTTLELGEMLSPNTCTVGELPLDEDDLLINSSLKGKLVKGDLVALMQLFDQEEYVILCKVVSV